MFNMRLVTLGRYSLNSNETMRECRFGAKTPDKQVDIV